MSKFTEDFFPNGNCFVYEAFGDAAYELVAIFISANEAFRYSAKHSNNDLVDKWFVSTVVIDK